MIVDDVIEYLVREPLEEALVLALRHDEEVRSLSVAYDYPHDVVDARFRGAPLTPRRDVRLMTFKEVTDLEVEGARSLSELHASIVQRPTVFTLGEVIGEAAATERVRVRLHLDKPSGASVAFGALRRVELRRRRLEPVGDRWLEAETGDAVDLLDPFGLR